MAETLPAYLDQLVRRIDGLHGVLVTDRDGVTLAKSTATTVPQSLEPNFATTFSTSSEQASKLGIGKNKVILSSYAGYQVAQFNHAPLLVTLIASKEANTGVLLEAGNELQSVLQPAATAVQELSSATK